MPKPNKKRVLQGEAVRLLASGAQILATAQKIGVNESTLHRWLGTDDFKKELDDAKRNIVQASIAAVGEEPLVSRLEKQLEPLAVEMLKISRDVKETTSVRISASGEYRNLLKHLRANGIMKSEETLIAEAKAPARKISEHRGDPRGILKAVEK